MILVFDGKIRAGRFNNAKFKRFFPCVFTRTYLMRANKLTNEPTLEMETPFQRTIAAICRENSPEARRRMPIVGFDDIYLREFVR